MGPLQVELDHVLFFCDRGAPEADVLLGRGLHEGPGNSHPGQGTVNRRFFFRNAYLELLWIENFEEATRPEVLPTQLWARWSTRGQGSCPFGLVFRPGPHAPAVPFDSHTYVPRYFPPGFTIEVATGIPANEPLLFYLPFAKYPLVEDVAPMPGGVRVGSITATTLHLPGTSQLSPALRSLVTAGVLAVEPGQAFCVDLEQAGGSKEIIDLRPQLPLRFIPPAPRGPAAH